MNKNNCIRDKEIQVLEQFSNNCSINQRDISRNLGFSLGLTNIIIKKLIKMGYIKVKQLNKRNLQYLLTPKGITEKTKKSYNFFLKTINILRDTKEIIQKRVLDKYNKGYKTFHILGDNELSILTEIALRDMKIEDIVYRKIKDVENISVDAVIISVDKIKDNINSNNIINLVEILAKNVKNI